MRGIAINWHKVWVITRKEWSEMFKNKYVMLMTTLLPMILLIIPLVFLYMTGQPGAKMNGIEDIANAPAFAGMNPVAAMQILIIQQFMFYFLMMPVILPIYVASYGIIGEKQQRTLEPLLATPISVTELLTGKAMAALIPAVGITWAAYVAYAFIARFLTSAEVWAYIVSPMWVAAILILSPLLAILAIMLGVIVSSRVNDVRLAEQISGFMVLPVVLVGIPLTATKTLVSPQMFLIGIAIVLVADIIMLWIGVRLFDRETILTRWK
jgi:ABC-2 type transport system permease protein